VTLISIAATTESGRSEMADEGQQRLDLKDRSSGQSLGNRAVAAPGFTDSFST
jgi:hypothetical protein